MTTSRNPLDAAQQAWEAGHDCTAYLVNILLWRAGSKLRVNCKRKLPKSVSADWFGGRNLLRAARTLEREHSVLVRQLRSVEGQIGQFPSYGIASKGAERIKPRLAEDVVPWMVGIYPVRPDELEFASRLRAILDCQFADFPAEMRRRWVKAMESHARKWRNWFERQRRCLLGLKHQLTVDVAKQSAMLDGTPYPLPKGLAPRWLAVLASKPNEWVSSTDLKTYDRCLQAALTHRLKKQLPEPIRKLIETKTGTGSRLNLS